MDAHLYNRISLKAMHKLIPHSDREGDREMETDSSMRLGEEIIVSAGILYIAPHLGLYRRMKTKH